MKKWTESGQKKRWTNRGQNKYAKILGKFFVVSDAWIKGFKKVDKMWTYLSSIIN